MTIASPQAFNICLKDTLVLEQLTYQPVQISYPPGQGMTLLEQPSYLFG